MGGGRIPGVLGTEPPRPDEAKSGGQLPQDLGFSPPGPLGLHSGSGTALAVTRIVKDVTNDWVPPSPTTTPEIVVRGRTLAEVGNELNRLPEWGQGGGTLRADPAPAGTSPEVTVSLHANLVLRMPRWTRYAEASAAARAEWDQMIAKLRVHEERHVAIAIEEANSLASALIGVEISEIAGMVTDANQTMQARQDELDRDTENGSRPGVPYGDVSLDTSIE